jgi:predicted transcriptional regulator
MSTRYTIHLSEPLASQLDILTKAAGDNSRQRSKIIESALTLYFDSLKPKKSALDVLLESVQPDQGKHLALAEMRDRLFAIGHETSTQALRRDLIGKGWEVLRTSRGMPAIRAIWIEPGEAPTVSQEAATPAPSAPVPESPRVWPPTTCPSCKNSPANYISNSGYHRCTICYTELKPSSANS